MRIEQRIGASLLLLLPAMFLLSATPAFAAFSTIRVKAGAAYTDSTKAVWSSDASSCTGGTLASTAHAITGALPAASDQALYQPERYGNSTCTFTAPAGTYNVTIKLAEDYWTASGKRLFSVSINGVTVLSAFDIFATAGGEYKAIDKTFSTTTTGSPITVNFINGSIDYAKYDAIQIALNGGPAPAPGIASISPISGMQGQSLAAVITGSNFQSGATCSFGSAGITVTSCAFNSATKLTANIAIASTATLGVRTITVTNPDNQIATLANAFTVNQAPPPPPFSTIRVKAGAAYTDSTKAVWSSDASSCTGGTLASAAHAITGALPAASDQALYQPERYGNSTCTFTAPAGTYNVTIKLAEDYWTASGKRLFSVSINGVTVLSAFDIFATAGGEYKAIDKTFSTTTTGSPITVNFINGSIDYAKYDAIQITANNSGLAASVTATTGTPQDTTINTAFVTALQATVKDASGNPVAGVMVTFAAPSSGASGTFPGLVNTANVTTNSTGVATAPAFTANSIGGAYTVTASASGAASAGFSLTNDATPAISIAISPKRGGLTITQTLPVSATVQNDVAAAGVTWSASGATCSGASCGTFINTTSTSATYVAPSTAGVYSITATSVADVTKSASNSIGVTDLLGVFTYHNNLSRDGTNTQEFALTTSNVNTSTFGKIFSCPADGAIYAQPLWVSNLLVASSPHNVIIVATQHDSLYAFDADAASCTTLWHVNLIDGTHGGTSGETTVPSSGAGALIGSGYGDISPEVGITGTPIIDQTTDTLYVVSKSVNTSTATTQFFQRLHAIDLTTGNEVVTPRMIDSSISVPGTGDGSVAGQVAFDPRNELQRPGLTLSNGVVYVAWASHEDHDPYHGWVIGFDASTLTPVVNSVFNTTPNRVGSLTYSRGGIWMGGGAAAVDSSGNLFFITGNGTFDANTGGSNYGDSVVKLSTVGGLSVADYFTPLDQASLDAGDTDFGSGATTILIDQPAGPVPHLLIGGGKEGNLFLLNRENMGKFSTTSANKVVQTVNLGHAIFATPVFWQNNLYVAGIGPLNQYIFNTTTGQFNGAPFSQSSSKFGFPGSTPSLSSGGITNGILWALDNTLYCTQQSSGCGATVLHAYNATNLTSDLWNSSLAAGNRDQAGHAVKFTVPTVANGKVYVGTRGNDSTVLGELDVYGLLPN